MANYRPKSLNELNQVYDKALQAQRAIKEGSQSLSNKIPAPQEPAQNIFDELRQQAETAKKPELYDSEIADIANDFLKRYTQPEQPKRQSAPKELRRPAPSIQSLYHTPVKPAAQQPEYDISMAEAEASSFAPAMSPVNPEKPVPFENMGAPAENAVPYYQQNVIYSDNNADSAYQATQFSAGNAYSSTIQPPNRMSSAERNDLINEYKRVMSDDGDYFFDDEDFSKPKKSGFWSKLKKRRHETYEELPQPIPQPMPEMMPYPEEDDLLPMSDIYSGISPEPAQYYNNYEPAADTEQPMSVYDYIEADFDYGDNTEFAEEITEDIAFASEEAEYVPEMAMPEETEYVPEMVMPEETEFVPEMVMPEETEFVPEMVMPEETEYVPEMVIPEETEYVPEMVMPEETEYVPEMVMPEESEFVPEMVMPEETEYVPEMVIPEEAEYVPEMVMPEETEYVPEMVIPEETEYVPEMVIPEETEYVPEMVMPEETEYVPEMVMPEEAEYVPEMVMPEEAEYVPEMVIPEETEYVPEEVIHQEYDESPTSGMVFDDIFSVSDESQRSYIGGDWSQPEEYTNTIPQQAYPYEQNYDYPIQEPVKKSRKNKKASAKPKKNPAKTKKRNPFIKALLVLLLIILVALSGVVTALGNFIAVDTGKLFGDNYRAFSAEHSFLSGGIRAGDLVLTQDSGDIPEKNQTFVYINNNTDQFMLGKMIGTTYSSDGDMLYISKTEAGKMLVLREDTLGTVVEVYDGLGTPLSLISNNFLIIDIVILVFAVIILLLLILPGKGRKKRKAAQEEYYDYQENYISYDQNAVYDEGFNYDQAAGYDQGTGYGESAGYNETDYNENIGYDENIGYGNSSYEEYTEYDNIPTVSPEDYTEFSDPDEYDTDDLVEGLFNGI